MSTSLATLSRHFMGSNSRNIVAAGEALANGNWASLDSVVTRVSRLEATASISNLVNSSSANLREFLRGIESRFDPKAINMVFGGVLAGVGGAALFEAAGLAATIGVSVLTVQVVAIVLLLWGLSIVLPAIWQRAMEKIGGATEVLWQD